MTQDIPYVELSGLEDYISYIVKLIDWNPPSNDEVVQIHVSSSVNNDFSS